METIISHLLADRLFWISYEKDSKKVRKIDCIVLLDCYHNNKDKPFTRYNLTGSIKQEQFSVSISRLILNGYILRLSNSKYLITSKGIDFCLSYIEYINSFVVK